MSTAPRVTPVRVLSVSADAGLSLSRELVLTRHGYTVTSTLSREHALHLIASHTFDLLLLGSKLGSEICTELGKAFRAHNPRAKVIEVLIDPMAKPMNNPDAIVAGSDGPVALLETIEAELG